ncbi:MAG: M1 family metallopeptidase [Caldilineaceae bacterium]|nr:M1 family metallopeptidase [Caldilineaceae bacterium]MBP8106014.1 M1 family metallopeptidase [Caldilineaceae bacterium]MBP8123124.1 M1 family metallopeptidase [Caldilineaceae bacterium]MBP9071934.1 M1 family metallopeptidase [Caldilineaceae bacterium]
MPNAILALMYDSLPILDLRSIFVRRSTTLLGAVLFLAGIFLSGCTLPFIREPVDPYLAYYPALKESYRADLVTANPVAQQMPRYDITFSLNPNAEKGENALRGSQSVHILNPGPDPWPHLIFRLYPMLDQYKGSFSIGSMAVNGQPVAYTFVPLGTGVRIDLPQPLLAGQETTVQMNWSLSIPLWPDSPGVYALFGRSQEMISLPLFYPALAVYQPGPTIGTGKWWEENGTVRGDAAFNVSSLFVVTGTLPSDQIPVTSGVVVTSTVMENGTTQRVWVTGPVREFLFHTSSRFETSSAEVAGTKVTSYWLPGQNAAGRAALNYAVAAMRVYNDRFGDYPFTEMAVAVAPLEYRGMEYPQVSLIGVQSYTDYRGELEFLIAHEVAHQWWYQMVHNDPVTYPWMDEGLAEYSVRVYYEAMQGPSTAEGLQNQRWQVPVNLLIERESDTELGKPVDAYDSGSQYETVVYGKGALFFAAARRALGERAFEKFLHSYLADNRWTVVTPDTLFTQLDLAAYPTLVTLVDEWGVRFFAPTPVLPTPQP